MTQNNIFSSLSVFDYAHRKLCDLYDSQNDLEGQAYNISFKRNMTDGIKELSFSIPYIREKKDSKTEYALPVDTKKWTEFNANYVWDEVKSKAWSVYAGYISEDLERDSNYRWNYLKSEYLIRLIYNGSTEWYIAQKPIKHKDGGSIYGEVHCVGLESSLKTKNIYMEFDDENGIGTIGQLADKVLAGTGWHRGHTDSMLEADGVTEKIRSLTSGGKQGALGLMSTLCNLFKCFPVYKSDSKTVELYNYNNRDQVLEGTIGVDLDALSVTHNSSDIITRLYVEGEYGDDGYIGIDDVNPTGLNYIMNFDYYREIGVFTAEHEAALETYLRDIKSVKDRISENSARMTVVEDEINDMIGQCDLVLYYASQGFTTPAEIYGNPKSTDIPLAVGNKVVVLNSDGTYRYETIATTPAALIGTGDYGIAKFITGAAGALGSNEVQVEAKEKQIANLQRKIASTSKEDKIAEYTAEINELQAQINEIYTRRNTGLYAQMDSLMKAGGLLQQLDQYKSIEANLKLEQDDIESDFIIAMGDMLRDGYWNNSNYIQGQEQHLFDDAVERLNIMSKPTVSYEFSLVRVHKQFGIPLEDFKLNAIFRINDKELAVHDNLFITEITIGVDDESQGSIEVSNQDITINANSLSELLSRMSQLADLIEQKNTLYDRAQAITKNKTIYVDRLNGQIDVLKNQLLSTVSNWYTDDQGNILFEAADGGSAMMLCGAGFMIANSKDDQGEWNWRTFGTGEGFTADEIVAGFISAERIEAGSIATSKLEPDAGNTLVISGNPSIVNLNTAIAPQFVEGQAYSKGDYVSNNGRMYIFTADYAGGTFVNAPVSDTSVAAQIELLPDEIIQYVGSKGYSKTFVSFTDPKDDPNNDVAVGDYWVVKSDPKTWNTVKNGYTWNTLKDRLWGVWAGYGEVYCLDQNRNWFRVYDTSQVASAFTQITQTQYMIQQEAERANAAEGVLRSTITQTADSITSEVTRAKAAEAGLIAKTEDYNTVNDILTEAQNKADAAATSAKNASIAKTAIYQDAESIVTVAVASSSTNIAPAFSTSTAYAVGDIVSYNGYIYKFKQAHPAGAWNASHVDMITVSGSYVASTTTYQTADAIVTEASRLAGVAETNAKNASIARTQTYQDADSIVTSAIRTSATNIAPAFSTSTAYAKGDIVSYNGNIYKFNQAHAAGAWNASHVDQITVNSGYVSSTSTYQTADSIVTEASRLAGVAETNAKNASIAKDGSYTTVTSILNEAQNKADAAATSAKNASIARTQTYQTADSIVSSAIASSAANIAPAFSTSTAYAKGDTVSYNGKVYRFKQAHSAGAWNASHVDEITVGGGYIATTTSYQTADSIVTAATSYTDNQLTNYSTTTQTSSMISTYVGNQNFAKTFIQSSDPSASAKAGDYWVDTGKVNTWTGVKTTTWQTHKTNSIWYNLYAKENMYYYNGSSWIQTNDVPSEATAFSRIVQTQDKIDAEVSRAKNAETTLYSNFSMTAEMIKAEVSRAQAAESGLIAKTSVYQTADSIVATATSYTDNKAYAKVSGITITANGIDISGSQYVKIASGGYFQVTTGNFGINTNNSDYVIWSGASSAASSKFWVKKNGDIYSTSGTIGGWSIATDGLSKKDMSGTTVVSNVGMSSSGTYAFYAGQAATAADCAFKVSKQGKVWLTHLYARTVDETAAGYDPTNPNTWTWIDSEVDLGTNGYKIGSNYSTVRSVNSSTGQVTLSNGVSFSTAASVYLTGEWSSYSEAGSTHASYTATAKTLMGVTVDTITENPELVLTEFPTINPPQVSASIKVGSTTYATKSIETTATYNKAQENVTAADVSWAYSSSSVDSSNRNTNTVYSKTSGRHTSTGAATESSKSEALTLDIGSWSSGSRTILVTGASGAHRLRATASIGSWSYGTASYTTPSSYDKQYNLSTNYTNWNFTVSVAGVTKRIYIKLS